VERRTGILVPPSTIYPSAVAWDELGSSVLARPPDEGSWGPLTARLVEELNTRLLVVPSSMTSAVAEGSRLYFVPLMVTAGPPGTRVCEAKTTLELGSCVKVWEASVATRLYEARGREIVGDALGEGSLVVGASPAGSPLEP